MNIRRIANQFFVRFYLKGTSGYNHTKQAAYLKQEEFQAEQLNWLNSTLNLAEKEVPFYRNYFTALDRNNNNINISSTQDLEKLPILTKSDIRSAGANLYARHHKKRNSFINSSGGSTGEPLKILQDQPYKSYSSGVFAFIKEIRTGDPYCESAKLWGAARDLYGMENNVKGAVIDFFNNLTTFNSAKLQPKDIEAFIDFINAKKPQMIAAYVKSIYEVSLYAKKNGIKIEPQQCIHTGAGQLFPFMRELIESEFQCKVFNHYGARETGALATECSAHDGLHIMSSSVYLEVVNDDGNACKPGEEGDVLVTTLRNQSMPLIRYKIGDRAIAKGNSTCSCGIVFPKIQRISGRTVNNFKTPEGGFVSGEYMTLTFNHIPGVINFQIRQKALLELSIYLVVNQDYNKENENEVGAKFIKLFGPEIKYNFHYVDQIPLTSSGKHLFTICEIE